MSYEVIVSNIGTVYRGNWLRAANAVYARYVNYMTV